MVAESIWIIKLHTGFAYLTCTLNIFYYKIFFMKTEAQLNNDILDFTMKMQQQFPELSKYVTEMPDATPDSNDPEINKKRLQEYYDSLKALVNKYSTSHTNNP